MAHPIRSSLETGNVATFKSLKVPFAHSCKNAFVSSETAPVRPNDRFATCIKSAPSNPYKI